MARETCPAILMITSSPAPDSASSVTSVWRLSCHDFGFIARPRQEPPRMAIDTSGIRSLYERPTIYSERIPHFRIRLIRGCRVTDSKRFPMDARNRLASGGKLRPANRSTDEQLLHVRLRQGVESDHRCHGSPLAKSDSGRFAIKINVDPRGQPAHLGRCQSEQAKRSLPYQRFRIFVYLPPLTQDKQMKRFHRILDTIGSLAYPR